MLTSSLLTAKLLSPKAMEWNPAYRKALDPTSSPKIVAGTFCKKSCPCKIHRIGVG